VLRFLLVTLEKIKDYLKRIARYYGFVVQRYDPRNPLLRYSLNGSMTVARGAGFTPKTIIDVGAARGCWSAEVSSIWPDARYVLIDPLEENHQELKCICRKLKNADYRIAAITAHSGKITINVHPDLDGSSIYLEREDNINGVPREVACITLDDLIVEMRLENPTLLKADVQGAEMQVLLGAEKSLPLIDMVVLEMLLFDIYQGRSLQLYDMINYMKYRGFVTWDIFGMGYRMLDDALSQIDMVFVRDDGIFRKAHGYATEAQRVAQLAAIQTGSPKRFKQI
jgi:FkbM family methyltransferase